MEIASQELINVTEPAQSGLEMSIWILAASPDAAPTAQCGENSFRNLKFT